MTLRFTVLVLVSLGSLGSATAAAADPPSKEKVGKAVDKAVAFLKEAQDKKNGLWIYDKGTDEYDIGATALVGLALLESGVARDDPCINVVVVGLRRTGPGLSKTYAIGTTALFLDRYGDPRDSALIRQLGVRLAAGQDQQSGGWGYKCPVLSRGQQSSVWNFLVANRTRTIDRTWSDSGVGDNSNVQFALLGLWVARRHGVPAEFSLALADWRFRNTQDKESGGWSYGRPQDKPSGTMTCAGLLGLALGFGAAKSREASLRSGNGPDALDDPKKPAEPSKRPPEAIGDIRTDKQVLAAKQYLAKTLKRTRGDIGHFMYFLWALERVGVTYGFDDFGGQRWYDWGTTHLLETQKENGSWELGDKPVVATAFALLFLRQANLLADLRPVIDQKARFLPADDRMYIAEEKAPARAKELLTELIKAKPERQAEILAILQETRDSSGSFTQALIDAIPKVSGPTQERVREALAERLSRQPVTGLRKRLQDTEPEVRAAAARASGSKGDKQIVPDLISLLNDSKPAVATAAEKALGELTGENFGRNADRWREYWQRQKP